MGSVRPTGFPDSSTAEVAALRDTQERLRLAMEAASMGAWDWDLESNRVVWSGDQELLFGIAAGQFDGTFDSFARHVHPEDIDGLQQRMREAVEAGRHHHRDEFRILLPDGNARWMLANGRIYYDESGRAVRMIGINMDITERKRAEEALRQSERLAATGRLAAAIAHELNNPLASVTNLLYILESHTGPDDPARSYIKMGQEELARMARIVHQTLAFHRQPDSAVPVTLSELLSSVISLLQPRLRAHNVELVLRIEGDAVITGFPAELRQLFSNLLVNACDAVGDRGIVTVHAYPSRRWCAPGDEGVRVVVADTGPGIPAEIRKRMWEPFFTTKGAKGSGLGLWVCAGIIAKHGGAIQLASSTRPPRNGTAFSIFFPGVVKGKVAPPQRKGVKRHRPPVQMPLALPHP